MKYIWWVGEHFPKTAWASSQLRGTAPGQQHFLPTPTPKTRVSLIGQEGVAGRQIRRMLPAGQEELV